MEHTESFSDVLTIIGIVYFLMLAITLGVNTGVDQFEYDWTAREYRKKKHRSEKDDA